MIQEFLDYQKSVRGLSENTLRAYKSDLADFVAFAKEKTLRWSTLTEQNIDEWLTEMAHHGVTARTRNRRLSALRSLLTWAHHKGMLSENAARYCQSAKTDKQLPQTIDTAAIDKFLRERTPSVKSNVVALMVSIMLEAGLRLQEVIDLQAQDIDTEAHSIRVKGKGGKERIVFYGERTAKELETILPAPKGRIFPTWNTRTYRRDITAQLYTFTGPMHPHMLRHTYATQLLNNGMPMETLSTLMGHSKIETTQIYAKVATETAKAQYEQFKIQNQ